ncbi:hypothetical protein HDE_05234 [Halotydeus destructor]|nr:hypothetical protein HDE_05234 [Halotydeus destructor]
MFDVTEDGVKVLNELDAHHVTLLFKTVLEKLSPKQFNVSLLNTIVSEKSNTQIPGINDEQLEALVASLEAIGRQAVHSDSSLNSFYGNLIKAGLNELLAKNLCEQWSAEKNTLRKRFIGSSLEVAPSVVDDVSWKVKVIASSSQKRCTKIPLVQLDLRMTSKKCVSIDFDHSQLSDFYRELERIQNQIDHIQKN